MSDEPEDVDEVPDVDYVVTDEGRAMLVENANWLFDTFPTDPYAVRFLQRFNEEMISLCERWRQGFRPAPDERATQHFSRLVFQHLLRTAQRRTRRSSSGTWRIYYEAVDQNGDGIPDLLRVFSIRHAASQTIGNTSNDADE